MLVYGVGATLVTRGDLLLYADITRWELQLRFRRGADNWRTARHGLPKLSKYKRGLFCRMALGRQGQRRPACRRLTITLTQQPRAPPALLPGDDYRAALAAAARRPFRMAPYYDPASGAATG